MQLRIVLCSLVSLYTINLFLSDYILLGFAKCL